jgi:hypothetical protein
MSETPGAGEGARDDLTPPGPAPGAERGEATPPNPYFPYAPIALAPQGWREFDRSSLVSFLLALTWIGAPVAVILGVRGIRRTADDSRVGRWAAITGIVVGLLGTLTLVAGISGTMWLRDNFKSVGRVEAGDCVDVDDSDGVSFDIRSCDDPHHGEVAAAGDLDHAGYADFLSDRAAEFCFGQLDEHYREAARTGRYVVTVVIDAPDPDRPTVGDAYACYFSSADGRDLTAAVDDTDQDGSNA